MCRTDASSPCLQTSSTARKLRDDAVYSKARGRVGSVKPSTPEATPQELPTRLFLLHRAHWEHSCDKLHLSCKFVKINKAIPEHGYASKKQTIPLHPNPANAKDNVTCIMRNRGARTYSPKRVKNNCRIFAKYKTASMARLAIGQAWTTQVGSFC